MNGKRAVVTGATGHIGTHVAHALLDRGYSVTLLVRRLNESTRRLATAGATLHLCDLMRPLTYKQLLHDKDVLFHLAAENTTETSDEARVIASCLDLTKAVVGEAIEAAIPCVVYTSSVVVLGRSACNSRLLNEHDKSLSAESPYVAGKILAERWVASRALEGHDVRRVYPSWVVGPNDPKLTPPHKFIRDYAIRGQAAYFGGGVSIAHVEDVAVGHVLTYERGTPQGQYVLSGDNVTFKQLYDELSRVFRRRKPFVRVPKALIYTAARAMGASSPVAAQYVSAVIDRYSWYDNSRARHTLGYSPRPLKATLDSVCRDTRARIMGTLRLGDRRTTATATGAEKGPLLITGFPGWLGNRMVDILVNGDELGRNKTSRPVRLLVQPHMLDLVPSLPKNFEVSVGDVTDKSSLLRATRGMSAVWHLAGVIYPPSLQRFETVNITGTRNVADACVENGVRRVLYMSTDSCCGYTPKGSVFAANQADRPYKRYGRSKHAGEQYLMALTAQQKLQATSLRAFWFFGPNVPPRNLGFLRSFGWPYHLVFGNGTNRRSISHCDDIVNAFCLVEAAPASVGKWYWLPTFPNAQTVDEIYRMIGEGLGRSVRLCHVPNVVCDLLGWTDGFLTAYFHTLNPTLHAAGKFHKTIATDPAGAAPAFQDFGWKPAATVQQIQQEIFESIADA